MTWLTIIHWHDVISFPFSSLKVASFPQVSEKFKRLKKAKTNTKSSTNSPICDDDDGN